jgi:hypothetical protein
MTALRKSRRTSEARRSLGVSYDQQPKHTGSGIALGAALGAVAGVLAGHVAVWLGVGIAIGMVLGASFRRQPSVCPECSVLHQKHERRKQLQD